MSRQFISGKNIEVHKSDTFRVELWKMYKRGVDGNYRTLVCDLDGSIRYNINMRVRHLDPVYWTEKAIIELWDDGKYGHRQR